MAFCPNCGAQIAEGSAFCGSCGQRIAQVNAPAYQQPAPTYQQPAYQQPAQNESGYQPNQPYGSWNAQPVAPIPTGGLMVWAIITLFLSTIPGIVAIAQTRKINKSLTVEEQQKHLKNAKIWCIIGTIIGILLLIAQAAENG